MPAAVPAAAGGTCHTLTWSLVLFLNWPLMALMSILCCSLPSSSSAFWYLGGMGLVIQGWDRMLSMVILGEGRGQRGGTCCQCEDPGSGNLWVLTVAVTAAGASGHGLSQAQKEARGPSTHTCAGPTTVQRLRACQRRLRPCWQRLLP